MQIKVKIGAKVTSLVTRVIVIGLILASVGCGKRSAGTVAVNDLAELTNLLITAVGPMERGDLSVALTNFPRAQILCQQLAARDTNAYVNLLSAIGNWHLRNLRSKEAELFVKEALRLQRILSAGEDLTVGQRLDNVGTYFFLEFDYAEALRHWSNVLVIHDRLIPENEKARAIDLHGLATCLKNLGSVVEALAMSEEALGIRQRGAHGRDDAEVAESLNDVASCAKILGRHAEALEVARQAYEMRARMFPDGSREVAMSLSLYASCLEATGDKKRREAARGLHEQSLEMRIRFTGGESMYAAVGCHYLAKSLSSLGRDQEALALHKRAFKIWRNRSAEPNSQVAESLENMADCLTRLDRHRFAEAAEAYYREALEIRTRHLGERHPAYAAALRKLGNFLARTSRKEEGLRHLATATGLMRRNLSETFGFLSEHQQLLLFAETRQFLESYLSARVALGAEPGSVYDEVLQWKGAVTMRQAWLRHQADQAGAAPLLERLGEATRAWGTLVLMDWPADEKGQSAREDLLARLYRDKEQAHAELASLNAAFAREQEAQLMSGAGVQERLRTLAGSNEVAVLDFIEFEHGQAGAPLGRPPPKRLGVFVVRKTGAIEFRELGGTEEIGARIKKWREIILTPYGRSWEEERAAGEFVWKALWEPLVADLKDVRTVLISADGPVGLVPFSALPGRAPNTYLIHELAIGHLPVAQQLGERKESVSSQEKAGLLLVGDIDYAGHGVGGPSGNVLDPKSFAGSRRAKIGRPFQALKYTREEMAGVRRHAPEGSVITMLSETNATEMEVRRAVATNQWIFIGTHAYFAEPQIAADDGAPVGAARMGSEFKSGIEKTFALTSGLALTGANRRVQAGEFDGLWTAGEVAASDLRKVDLVFIPNCGTGLGQIVPGEGVLSLERGFLIGGARSVLGTLWPVYDNPLTLKVIEGFCENYWTKGMSKLEALRAAQIGVMDDATRYRARSSDGTMPPGLPVYWAGFVLSGQGF